MENSLLYSIHKPSPTVYQLKDCDTQEEDEWDRFVQSSPDGTIFHLTAWKWVIKDAFGHTPYYLLASEGNDIRAVLPLFEMRNPLTGRVLISVPYGVYGGLCGTDPLARWALLNEARQLAARRRVRHVELRHLYEVEPTLPTQSLYVTFMKPIDPDPEANLAAVPRKQRRMIRQGIKFGLEARWGWEHLGRFYELFVLNKRRLGSPAFPRRLFEAARDHFGKQAQLLTIWHQEEMVAGVVSFFYQDRVMPSHSASRDEALHLAANDFMYWELMREACIRGYRVFDFGRSRQGTGPYDFKRHWGFEPKPLAYQYMLVNGHEIPNVTPSNPRFQPFIKVWKRLPFPVVKFIGPVLTRWLPS